MKTLRFIAVVLAVALATPFLVIGLIVGPMKLGFEVGLELWDEFERSARSKMRRAS